MKKVSIAAAVLAAFCTPAQADIIIDQSNLAVPPSGGQPVWGVAGQNVAAPGLGAGNWDIQLIQSVTAGTSGRLAALDLQLARANQSVGTFHVAVATNVSFNSDGSVAGANVIGGYDLQFTSLQFLPQGGLVNIDTSALNLNLNAGDQFWIGVWGNLSGASTFWAFGTAPTSPPANNATWLNYAGGAGYVGAVQAGSEEDVKYMSGGQDYAFRSWMDTGAVPEPASWAMMIAGLAVVGGVMRRRPQVAVSFA